MRPQFLAVMVATAGAPTLVACSQLSETCENAHTCWDGGLDGTAAVMDGSIPVPDADSHDGGMDATDRPDGPVPGDAAHDADADARPTCDSSKTPAIDPCVISPEFGVFVSPSSRGGDDVSGDGTPAKPFMTIEKGIVAATAAGKRVYACEGTYQTAVAITASVSLFGGFSCPTLAGDSGPVTPWAYGSTRAKLVGASKDYVVSIAQAQGVSFEDFEIQGADAASAGQSSTAVRVTSSVARFTRVSITAGAGADGAVGENGTAAPNFSAAHAPDGNAAQGDTGGSAQANACADHHDSQGGAAGNKSGDGSPGTPVYTPANPPGKTGARGTTGGDCGTGGTGISGSYGTAGQGGGGTAVGAFAIQGGTWTPATGGSAQNGAPGQGGGGGAGEAAGGGGSGGSGGCGGSGGKGGHGGGASFGLLSVNSTVTLARCVVASAKGGNGGKGGDGQPGQNPGGGAAGAGAIPNNGCSGGNGGFGGGGGGAQGGPGGVSAAIAYVGTKPAAGTDSTITPFSTIASGGLPGAFGASGGVPGGPGIKGVDFTPADFFVLPTQ